MYTIINKSITEKQANRGGGDCTKRIVKPGPDAIKKLKIVSVIVVIFYFLAKLPLLDS